MPTYDVRKVARLLVVMISASFGLGAEAEAPERDSSSDLPEAYPKPRSAQESSLDEPASTTPGGGGARPLADRTTLNAASGSYDARLAAKLYTELQLIPGVARRDGSVANLDSISAFLETVNNLGYSVRAGKQAWAHAVTPACWEKRARDDVFHFNNPFTLYGAVAIPVSPTELSRTFSLDGDDVIIVYGYTPAPITYLSFTLYQTSQYSDSAMEYVGTHSSIGLSINQDNINTLGGRPFEDFFVLIIAAKYSAADLATHLLTSIGIPQGAINHMLFPHRFTSSGKPFPDMLELGTRLTFRTEEEADLVCQFARERPANMKVLFLDGPGEAGDVEDDDLPTWKDTLRVDLGEWVSGADTGVGVLIERVRQTFESSGLSFIQMGREVFAHADSEALCRTGDGQSCHYDAPDAIYGGFICDTPGEGPGQCAPSLPNRDALIAIVGVNHHQFVDDTLGAYFSYTVNRGRDLWGIASVVDLFTTDTADAYLAGTGLNPNDFFVLLVSRDCADLSACIQVPWLIIPPGDSMIVLSRVYLDRVTGAGPNPVNFVPARLLWFLSEVSRGP